MPVSLIPDSGNDPLGLNGLLDTINKIFGTTTSTSGDTSVSLEDPAASLLKQLTEIIIPEIQRNDFSPQSANAQSAALIKQAMDEFTKNGLPQIYQAQQNSGGYNSTTAQLLANDAETSAASRAAANAADLQTKFAGARQNQINNLTNLVTMLSAILKRTSTSTNTDKDKSSTAAKLAALAAQAAKAAKRDSKNSPPAKGKNNTNPKPVPLNNDPTQGGDESDTALDSAINQAELENPELAPGGSDADIASDPDAITREILDLAGDPTGGLFGDAAIFGDTGDPNSLNGFDPLLDTSLDISDSANGENGDFDFFGGDGGGGDGGGSDTTSFLLNGGNTGDLPASDWWDSVFGPSSGDGFGSFFDDLFGTDNFDNFDFSFDAGDGGDFSFDDSDFGGVGGFGDLGG